MCKQQRYACSLQCLSLQQIAWCIQCTRCGFVPEGRAASHATPLYAARSWSLQPEQCQEAVLFAPAPSEQLAAVAQHSAAPLGPRPPRQPPIASSTRPAPTARSPPVRSPQRPQSSSCAGPMPSAAAPLKRPERSASFASLPDGQPRAKRQERAAEPQLQFDHAGPLLPPLAHESK